MSNIAESTPVALPMSIVLPLISNNSNNKQRSKCTYGVSQCQPFIIFPSTSVSKVLHLYAELAELPEMCIAWLKNARESVWPWTQKYCRLGVFQEDGYLSGQLSYDFKAVRSGQISARRNEKVLMNISINSVFVISYVSRRLLELCHSNNGDLVAARRNL